MIRFVPGLIGALAAYAALVLIGWLGNGWVRVAVFFGVYLFVTVAADRAMSRYRRQADKS